MAVVNVTITTNEQADNIVSPINQPVTTNPFTVTLTRQEVINISVEKDSAIVSDSIRVPKLLSTYFTISKIQTPSSASITVNNTLPSGILFSVEYSIDNVNWQTSTNFPNISFGDYTLYIRDNIGCSTSIDFSIDDFTPNLLDYEGVCEVSNINPIRYKEDVVWNDYVLKTPNNTLSFEENIKKLAELEKKYEAEKPARDAKEAVLKKQLEEESKQLIAENNKKAKKISDKRFIFFPVQNSYMTELFQSVP